LYPPSKKRDRKAYENCVTDHTVKEKSELNQAALKGRFSQRATRDVLQDLYGIQTLRAVSNHAINCVKYSCYQAAPKDRLLVSKSLFRSGLLRYSFLPPIYAIELASEKITNSVCDFLSVRFQSEVAGFEEAHLGARVIAFERFRSERQEERIAVAPDR
jgi:hypothetical protein